MSTTISPTRSRPVAVIASIAAVVALALSGCVDAGSASPQDRVLTLGVASGFDTLNPALDTVQGSTFTRYLASETLIGKDPETGEYVPALAESFGFVGDGNVTYQLTLREDAVFSDGTPLDSAAVKTWLEYFAGAGGGYTNLITLDSIETPDERTVVINLAAPNPNIEYFLAGGNNWGFVQSPAAVADPDSLTEETFGVGPYVLDASATLAGDRYAYLPNDEYYAPDRIAWDQVVVRVIDDPATMLKAIQAGEIDAAMGDFTTHEAAQNTPGVNVEYGITGWDPIILLPAHAPELQDERVRQALNYAIDRETITQAMVGEYGAPTSQMFTTDGVDPNYNDYYDYDPDKALSLLAEAGYPDGFALKVIDQGYGGNTGDPMVQVVADYLSDVGVQLEITSAPTSGELFTAGLSGEYGAWQFALGAVPMATYLGVFTSGFGTFDDPEIMSLSEQALTAAPDEVGDIWKAISRRVVESGIMLNVFTTPTFVYAADGIDGIVVTPALGVSPAIQDWRPAGE